MTPGARNKRSPARGCRSADYAYKRRDVEGSVLYRVVRDHVQTFYQAVEDGFASTPPGQSGYARTDGDLLEEHQHRDHHHGHFQQHQRHDPDQQGDRVGGVAVMGWGIFGTAALVNGLRQCVADRIRGAVLDAALHERFIEIRNRVLLSLLNALLALVPVDQTNSTAARAFSFFRGFILGYTHDAFVAPPLAGARIQVPPAPPATHSETATLALQAREERLACSGELPRNRMKLRVVRFG